MSNDPLLQPFSLRELELRNRVLSTSHEPAYSEGGMPTDRYIAYHVDKARGGVALTMVGGSALVAPDSPPAFGNLDVTSDAIVPHFRRLADALHAHDCAVMTQLTHLGRRTGHYTGDWLPVVSPSCVREPAHRAFPKILEDHDIRRIIRAFGEAARRCRQGGLDGIELEAYGHLMDAFWSPRTNRREDEWGGSLDNRTRFAREVIAEIRRQVGDDYVLGIRMVFDEDLEGGLARDEGLAIGKQLVATGQLDFVNVIRGHIETDEGLSHVIANMGTPQGPQVDFAGDIRAELGGIPVFHANRINDIATARYAIREQKLDMVGMTRAHMADPHIVNKVAAGAEDRIRPCVGAGYCIDRIYEGGEALCIHNPATGREQSIPQELARGDGPRRKVVVVGAGPAGLEAARVSAARGHEVVVLEAADRAGGQLALAAVAERRRELIGIVDWRLAELEHLGVSVRYNTYAEAEDVAAEGPDIVVVATGGLPKTDFLETGEDLVETTWDVLGGHFTARGSILLYDDNGQHPGPTCAEYLATRGESVEIVTPERCIGQQIGGTNYPAYLRTFHAHGVTITPDHWLRRVERGGDGRLAATLYNDYTKAESTRSFDHVVVENGTLPLDEVYEALRPGSVNGGETDIDALLAGRPQAIERNPGGRYRLFRVGDAVASRNVHAALLDAVRLCKDF
ncbi:MAG: NADH:flavin oxidoreductase [Halofilum sp. (in: g-proteobacteria)]|nr:NADH:flavin oxidoreductase [Halofilum sp. (in: g-proteobacteria)]